MLLNPPALGSNGTAIIPDQNVGQLENKGFEVEIIYRKTAAADSPTRSVAMRLSLTTKSNTFITIVSSLPNYMVEAVAKYQEPTKVFYGYLLRLADEWPLSDTR